MTNIKSRNIGSLTVNERRQVLDTVRELTNKGEHLKASTLYNTYFPQV